MCYKSRQDTVHDFMVCGYFLKIKCKCFEQDSRTVAKDGAMICQFMETLNLFISVLKRDPSKIVHHDKISSQLLSMCNTSLS